MCVCPYSCGTAVLCLCARVCARVHVHVYKNAPCAAHTCTIATFPGDSACNLCCALDLRSPSKKSARNIVMSASKLSILLRISKSDCSRRATCVSASNRLRLRNVVRRSAQSVRGHVCEGARVRACQTTRTRARVTSPSVCAAGHPVSRACGGAAPTAQHGPVLQIREQTRATHQVRCIHRSGPRVSCGHGSHARHECQIAGSLTRHRQPGFRDRQPSKQAPGRSQPPLIRVALDFVSAGGVREEKEMRGWWRRGQAMARRGLAMLTCPAPWVMAKGTGAPGACRDPTAASL